MVAQCVRAYRTGASGSPSTASDRNGFLILGACVAAVAVQALIPYVPGLSDAFQATPLDAFDWAQPIVALAPALLAEVVRTWQRGRVLWSPDDPALRRAVRGSEDATQQ